jgi:hypothetical protein
MKRRKSVLTGFAVDTVNPRLLKLYSLLTRKFDAHAAHFTQKSDIIEEIFLDLDLPSSRRKEPDGVSAQRLKLSPRY